MQKAGCLGKVLFKTSSRNQRVVTSGSFSMTYLVICFFNLLHLSVWRVSAWTVDVRLDRLAVCVRDQAGCMKFKRGTMTRL